MIKLKLVAIVMLFAMYGCRSENKQENNKTEQKDISQLFEQYWEERLKLFPLEATQQGDNRYNAVLVNDQTTTFRDSLAAFYQRYLDESSKFNRDQLAENDRLSYDIFNYEMKMQIEGLKKKE